MQALFAILGFLPDPGGWGKIFEPGLWVVVIGLQALTAVFSARRGARAEKLAKDSAEKAEQTARDAANKAAAVKRDLEQQDHKLETIHVLVNSAKGELLRSQMILADRIALLTKSKKDQEFARHCRKLSEDHDARQQRADAAAVSKDQDK